VITGPSLNKRAYLITAVAIGGYHDAHLILNKTNKKDLCINRYEKEGRRSLH
jgi:hypothetical protein